MYLRRPVSTVSLLWMASMAMMCFPLLAKSGKVLTLDEVLRVGEQGSIGMRNAQRDLERANLEKGILWSDFFPSLSVGRRVTEQRYRLSDSEFLSGSPRYDGQVIAQNYAQATWSVMNPASHYYQFGALELRQKKVSLEASAEKSLQKIRIVRAFVDAYSKQESIEILMSFMNSAKLEFARIQRVFKAGQSSKTDLLRAKLAAEKSDLDVQRAQNDFAAAKVNLALQLGQDLAFVDQAKFGFKPDTEPLYFAMSGSSLSKFLQRVLDKESSLKKIRQIQVDQSLVEKKLAAAEIWPSISLSVENQWSSLAPVAGEVRTAGPLYTFAVSWEVFNGGKDYFNYRLKQIDTEAALDEQNEFEKNLVHEVSKQYSLLMDLKSRMQLSSSQTKDRQEIVRMSEADYRLGRISARERDSDKEDLLQGEQERMELWIKLFEVIEFITKNSGSDVFNSLVLKDHS